MDALSKPGLTLRLARDVPRFRVDASTPGIVIRELGGVTERGRIVDGLFVAAD